MKIFKSSFNTLSIYFFTLIFISPITLMVLNAFKNEKDALSLPPKIFFHPTLTTIKNASITGYFGALQNSVIIVLVSTLFALVFAVPVAFGLAFFKYKRSKQTVFWILSTAFMPSVGVILPIYTVFNHFHLLDTRIAMILIYTSMNLPLSILILRSFYMDIPIEIVEASIVDGSKTLQLFRYIVAPLSIPAVGTAAVLSIIFAWNEFLFALMITSTNSQTLPIFIASSVATEGTSLAALSAASMLAAAPVVILGWVSPKVLVQGLTMGAVK